MEYKLSIAGLYAHDNTIFDNFHFPVTYTYSQLGIEQSQYIPDVIKNAITFDDTPQGAENRSALINKICADSFPFSCVYSSPDVLKHMIDVWTATRLPSWQIAYNTLFYAYNPLWNKDAMHTGTGTRAAKNKVNRASTAMDRTTYSSAAKDRNTDLVRSYEDGNIPVMFDPDIHYNSDMPDVTGKTVTEAQTQTENSGTPAINVANSSANSSTSPAETAPIENVNPRPDSEEGFEQLNLTPAGVSDMAHSLESIQQFDHAFTDAQNNSEDETNTDNWHEYGNIGVTSTQELIERSRKLALFNIYDTIVSEFINYFCVMVY